MPRTLCDRALMCGESTYLCYLRRPMARDDPYRAQIARLFERSSFYRENPAGGGFFPPRGGGGPPDTARRPSTKKDERRASRGAQPPPGAHAAIDIAQAARIYSASGTSGT